ncbi:MAG: glycosyltransferase family 2 protein [Prevotella sp.]|nr:glycosyltransferase family 2 protein [Prevotella sp.]
MKANINVSIIIVNYNTLHVLKPCIDSIVLHTKGISYEIIVVDNGSTDGSIEALSENKHILFIPTGKNLGFGTANNKGLEYARGQYIFFLNSDTLLKNNAIKMFYDFYKQFQGRIGALGCYLKDYQGNIIHSYGKFPKMRDDIQKLIWTPMLKSLHLFKLPDISYPEKWMKVDYVTGADLFISRKVLDECGSFHPAFFMYFEETEMEHRFMLHGYNNIVMHGPQIVHLEGESSKKEECSKFLRDTLRQQRSEYIYFRLTEPQWKYYIYRIIHPILRQSVWLNPNISITEKWKLFKQLFVIIQI